MSEPESKKNSDAIFNPARRDFAKMALGGAAFLSSARVGSATLRPIPPGIKIGTSAGQPTPENMLYLKQLGVTWVSLGATPETATAEGFIKMREQWEAGGFKVYNIGSGVGPSGSLHNMPGHAESSRTRPEDRRVFELHPVPRQSRHPLLHLRPYG